MNKNQRTKKLILVAILGAIGALLMLIQIPYPYPGAQWLQLEISDVPALIGGFSLGPWVGFLIIIIRSLLFAFLKFKPLELIGIPMSLLSSTAFVVVSSYIYKQKKNLRYAVYGLIWGVLASTIIITTANYFIIPVFLKIFFPTAPEMSPDQLIKFLIVAVTPFNIIRGIINGIITFFVYKRVSRFIKIND